MAIRFWNAIRHWRDSIASVFSARAKQNSVADERVDVAEIDLQPTRLQKIGTMKVTFRPGPGLRIAPVDFDDE